MTVNTDRYPLWESLVQPSRYGRPEVHGIGCEGNRVHFADGTSALDVMSGLWNANLGYGNKAVTEAITDCLNTASYLPLFRGGHHLAEQAARALLGVSGPDHFGRILFSTSGGAANDVMMKLVRHYQALRGEANRDVVVGLRNSWHGLTYGSFALTGQPLGQDVYRIDRSKVRHVSHEDVTELVELLAREGDKIAAVILEPVLGTGAHPVSDELLGAIEDLRAQYGFLVVADEVATGFGRTGSYFASQNWPFKPDVMITSKGLTNGTCAASAIVVSHDVCEMFERTDAVLFHGETQAGSPTSCAAIIATIAEMERLDAVALAQKLTLKLDALLEEISSHPLVVETRGLGCFRGIQLSVPSDVLTAACRRRGLIVQPGTDFIMLVPSLTYTADEFEELASGLRAALDEI
ncbi:aminotransferase class III-fold pyridoxal phosphate-dependent enzyme [Streptomyces sp. HNM0663]|uniref:Aminotransferase class III-fold pyridoxal phosphate-dependent enzyme n=1 Tax=Streptomyces chengmaiensis TaxID=3040919 RepID=A0ABT6HYQ6_9ACTN|nr:daptide-type RiPP biosynthesis aminotransferase [Streptomyces chengmaiensis]MDH2393854.1 aminotransferase class III-fold pyridoxal phosphate-dependent enzyme [Streptomyces chengmaiensis]